MAMISAELLPGLMTCNFLIDNSNSTRTAHTLLPRFMCMQSAEKHSTMIG
jgi:hypothetical protein